MKKLIFLACLMMICSSCQMNKSSQMLKVNGKKSNLFVLKGITGVTKISQITGNASPNQTDQYNVSGADLGSMFNVGERTYFVFGDTFGYRSPDLKGGGGSNWRSNTMAYSRDSKPADGIKLDGMIQEPEGTAKELLPSLKADNAEMTKIPTHGLAVGNTMYLYYMSVKHWGEPGKWDANYASMAKSTDAGQNWTLLDNVKWPGNSNFIQVSPYSIKVNDNQTDIYFWAIPAGRFGGVQLMKVNEKELENASKYLYYNGLDKSNQPTWSSDLSKASTIVSDTVGELSVIWNPYLERWIMMYLKEGTGVVIREGISPWGPWGEPIVVADKNEYPGLYGPFMNPKYMENNGQSVYFSLSLRDPYNVFWFKVDMVKG